MKTLVFVLMALLCSASHAQVQTVWRCGADGRSYSAVPCTGGQAMTVGSDARPDADLQAARQLASQDRREADRLRHDRLQQEARRGSGLVAITSAKPAPSSAAKARVLHKPPKPKAARSTAQQLKQLKQLRQLG